MENSREDNNGSFPNKYELAIIAAKEARRLNDFLRRSPEQEGVKVTLDAIERVNKGRVKYSYGREERIEG
jgi:DNA-directed RNA polymerase subunit K/omega